MSISEVIPALDPEQIYTYFASTRLNRKVRADAKLEDIFAIDDN